MGARIRLLRGWCDVRRGQLFGFAFCQRRELCRASCRRLERDAPQQAAAIIVEQRDSGFFLVRAAAFDAKTATFGNCLNHAGTVGFIGVDAVARG